MTARHAGSRKKLSLSLLVRPDQPSPRIQTTAMPHFPSSPAWPASCWRPHYSDSVLLSRSLDTMHNHWQIDLTMPVNPRMASQHMPDSCIHKLDGQTRTRIYQLQPRRWDRHTRMQPGCCADFAPEHHQL